MYTIRVSSQFSSAHNLRGYQGKCEELHGHNWKVEVAISRRGLDSSGMVQDFKPVRHRLNSVLERLDHKYLNKVAPFDKENPTSERIARYIYEALRGHFKGLLVSVTVWENDTSCATYAR